MVASCGVFTVIICKKKKTMQKSDRQRNKTTADLF